MDRSEVLSKVNMIALGVGECDSLSHLTLISQIEDEFGIKFTLEEVSDSGDIGKIVDAVMAHLVND